MSLQSQLELDATREKRRLLEQWYEARTREVEGDSHVRELSLSSLRRLIRQLSDEIARFESRDSTGANDGPASVPTIRDAR